MSTLTRQNRIPDYKEYVNFVSGYRNNGKKENSPKFEEKKCENNENSTARKLMKTEVFLVVNQDEESCIKKTIRNFENQNSTEIHGVGGVMSKKKMFENKSTENKETKYDKQKWNNTEKINRVNTTFLQQNKVKNEEKNIVSIKIIEDVNKFEEQNVKKEYFDKIDAAQNTEKINKVNTTFLQQIKNEERKFVNIKIIENTNKSNDEDIDKIEKVEIKKTEISPPPPPPPPMPNFSNNSPKRTVQKTMTIRVENDLNKKNSTLNRTDPLVKKLAYGAMLDMYGAYHDKANSYVATLPKNKVKKENGLQKIIDNIAAQGGLEKLSGRSNPKQDD